MGDTKTIEYALEQEHNKFNSIDYENNENNENNKKYK